MNNGTLFISQLEQVARLSCGPSCSFVPPSVPEPGSAAVFGVAFLLFFGARARKPENR
jgi:PEP-CTERM motif-containing protein